MNDTASANLTSYIEESTPVSPLIQKAMEEAAEFGLLVPSATTGALLSSLAGLSKASAAIAVTPAASVIGQYLFAGFPENTILSCIDPEPEHQHSAREAFRAAGISPSRSRFLPSKPLDVMGRLAQESYQLVYGEVNPLELRAFIDASLPLLTKGGVLILADCLLDGTVADPSRKDRDTQAVREAMEYLEEHEKVLISRLPLGAGLTIAVKC